MTEIKKLKEAWKGLDKMVEKKQCEVEQLRKIVQKKSHNELQKIKRKLLIDIVLSTILFVFLLFVVKKIVPTHLFWYLFLFVVSVIIIGAIPYLRICKLNLNFEVNLKQHLTLFLQNFEKLYKGIYFLLIPFVVVGSYVLSHFIWGSSDKALSASRLVVGIVVVVGLSFLSFFVEKCYFNWLYSNNLNQLKKLLKDLEEEDPTPETNE